MSLQLFPHFNNFEISAVGRLELARPMLQTPDTADEAPSLMVISCHPHCISRQSERPGLGGNGVCFRDSDTPKKDWAGQHYDGVPPCIYDILLRYDSIGLCLVEKERAA
jgi:hypothetical protein